MKARGATQHYGFCKKVPISFHFEDGPGWKLCLNFTASQLNFDLIATCSNIYIFIQPQLNKKYHVIFPLLVME
jgi:hypothetical protein